MNSNPPRPIIVGATSLKREVAAQLRRDMTAAERILRSQLRGNRLGDYHFRRQVPIQGFIVDFYCHQPRFAIELDGSVHDDQQEYNIERDRILSDAGLRVLRFKNYAVRNNLSAVLTEILDTLTAEILKSK